MYKKLALLLIAVVAFTCVSCSKPAPTPEPILAGAPPDDVTWISPGKVDIGNFHAGATAEFPLTIHCGRTDNDLITKQMFSVITEPKETVVDIDIQRPLYDNDLKRLTVSSDNSGDRLKAKACSSDGLTITIAGFVADDSRIIDMQYDGLYVFGLKFRLPSQSKDVVHAPEYVSEWVSFQEASPVFYPNETRDIIVSITIPSEFDESILPTNYEFWVSVKDMTQTSMVQTELCTRCRIAMRT